MITNKIYAVLSLILCCLIATAFSSPPATSSSQNVLTRRSPFIRALQRTRLRASNAYKRVFSKEDESILNSVSQTADFLARKYQLDSTNVLVDAATFKNNIVNDIVDHIDLSKSNKSTFGSVGFKANDDLLKQYSVMQLVTCAAVDMFPRDRRKFENIMKMRSNSNQVKINACVQDFRDRRWTHLSQARAGQDTGEEHE